MTSLQTERPGPAADVPTHLNSLTGLRWVAAFMVFMSHVLILPAAVPLGKAGESVSTFVSMGGYVGVSVFFVLSGFVLTWSARAKDTAPKFWRRRFFKVYPNHFIAFLIALAFMVWWGEGVGFYPVRDQLPGLVPQLLLVHAWLPDLDLAFSFNLVSWSLSVEALFYLSFPLLFAGARKIRPERLWYWAGGMVLLIFCVPQLAKLLPSGEIGYEGLGNWQYWFIYVLPLTRMAEFALGIMLARIVLAGRWKNIPTWLAALVFAVGYVVALNAPKDYAIVAITVIPTALLIPAFATADVKRGKSILATPVMRWLGDISYAFYLVHFFAIQLLYHVIGLDFQATPVTSVLFVVGALALGIGFAWVLHEVVEKPMMRRFATSRRPVVKSSS